MNYIKLINQFWQCNNELPIGTTATALYFYLLKVCNSLGWKQPFRHSDRYISNQLGISVNTVRSAKTRLVELGLIEYKSPEKASRGINGLTNYQILTISNFDSVPDSLDKLNKTETKLNNKIDNQRLSCENSYKFPPLRLYDSDFLFVQKLWNATCPSFRSVSKMTSKNGIGKRSGRKPKVRNRLNEIKELSKNGTKEEAFAILKAIFQWVENSKSLKGDNKRGWKASFDWLFRDSNNWVKVFEENYNGSQLEGIICDD